MRDSCYRGILSVTTNGLVHVWDLTEDNLTKDTTPLHTLKSIAKTGSRTTCLDVCVLGINNKEMIDTNNNNNNNSDGSSSNSSGNNNNKNNQKKKKNKKRKKNSGGNNNNNHNKKKK